MKLYDTDKIYFIADTHFIHRNIVDLANRPFKDINDMDEQLIKNWNDTVPSDGIVFHLGDFSIDNSKSKAIDIAHRLNGYIYLVKGNHDKKIKNEFSRRFERIDDYIEVRLIEDNIKTQDVMLFHYPMYEWNKIHRGAWSLFGHVHGGLSPFNNRAFDVGVDSIAMVLKGKPEDYRPISYNEVKSIMDKKRFVPVSHHT